MTLYIPDVPNLAALEPSVRHIWENFAVLLPEIAKPREIIIRNGWQRLPVDWLYLWKTQGMRIVAELSYADYCRYSSSHEVQLRELCLRLCFTLADAQYVLDSPLDSSASDVSKQLPATWDAILKVSQPEYEALSLEYLQSFARLSSQGLRIDIFRPGDRTLRVDWNALHSAAPLARKPRIVDIATAYETTRARGFSCTLRKSALLWRDGRVFGCSKLRPLLEPGQICDVAVDNEHAATVEEAKPFCDTPCEDHYAVVAYTGRRAELAISPTSETAVHPAEHLDFGIRQLFSGKRLLALAAFERCAQISSESVYYKPLSLAYGLLAQGHWDLALAMALGLEKKLPRSFPLLLLLALCRNNNGDFAEALLLANAARSMDPHRYEAWILAAIALCNAGRYRTAASYLQKCLPSPSEHQLLQDFLLLLQQVLGEATAHASYDMGIAEKKRRDMLVPFRVDLLDTLPSTLQALPRFINIGLTDDCMLRCKMCFKWRNNGKATGIVPVAIWKRFISEIAELCPEGATLNFAGGEPLYYPETIGLIAYAAERGVRSNICTNGYRLNPETLKMLGDAGLAVMALSLDSMDETLHDTIRGVRGVYRRIIDALDFVEREQLPFAIELQPLIMKANAGHLAAIVDKAESLQCVSGVNFLALIHPHNATYQRDWNTGTFANLWPDGISVQQDLATLILRKQQGGKISNPLSQLAVYQRYYASPQQFLSRITPCDIGERFLNVTFNGTVELCPYIGSVSTILGNVQQQSLWELWHSPEAYNIRNTMRSCEKNCYLRLNCLFDDPAVGAHV